MKFCSSCGTSLIWKEIEQKQRAYCPGCNRVHYEQLKVGAGAIIEMEGKILLLQRTRPPFAHCWNLPAGYVDVDENPAQAAIREVNEEVGLQVEIVDLADVYFFNDDPRGNGIFIVYNCLIRDGALTESDEAVTPTCFAAKDIPTNLAGGGHDLAIRAWQKLRI